MDAQLNRNSSLLPFVLSQIGSGDNASFLNPIRSNETVSCRLLTIACFAPPKLVQVCEIPRFLEVLLHPTLQHYLKDFLFDDTLFGFQIAF